MKYKIVLYLSSKPSDGGKYQYSLALLESLLSLNQKKYTITIFYLYDHWLTYINRYKHVKIPKNTLIVRFTKHLLFQIHPGLGRDIWRQIGLYLDAIHIALRKEKPDLVIYGSKDLLSIESKFRFAIPIFDLMHKYEDFEEISTKIIKNERELYYTRICKYAALIFVDSKVGKTHVLDNHFVKKEKIKIVYYSAPPYLWNNKNSSNSLCKLNLPEKYFFYPAQFWKHKNHELLINATNKLKMQNININFIFVGTKKNNYSYIINLINKYHLNENIEILDYVSNEDINILYLNAIALVMPSFMGPTNIPPIEAISLGCPVLVSDVYAAREQLADAALYFNPRDSESLIIELLKILTQKSIRETLIGAGEKRKEKFSIHSFSKQILFEIDLLFH